MKNLKLFYALLFIYFLSACNAGDNRDILTGLTWSYKKLNLEEAYITIDNDKLETSEIEYGKRINIVLAGVSGYELDNGKVQIGCKIAVSTSEGKVIISADDAFSASYEGGLTPEDAETLNTSLVIGKPLEIGKEYTWVTHFWDKNGKGTIDTEIKIKIIPRSE